MNDKRIWVVGAALVASLLLAVGYFVGVAPQLQAASASEAQRLAVQEQNAAIAADLIVLKKDYEDIERFKSVLAEVSVAVPDRNDLPRFVSQLDLLATVHTVKVTNFAAGEAKPYTGPVNALALGAPIGAERRAREATEKATLTGDANDVAVAAVLNNSIKRIITQPFESVHVTPQNFVAIPITLEATGDYNRLLDYVAALQNGARLMLVNSLSISKDDDESGVDSDAPAGRGEFKASLGGYIYVLLNSADAPIDQAAAEAAVAETAAGLAEESGEAAK